MTTRLPGVRLKTKPLAAGRRPGARSALEFRFAQMIVTVTVLVWVTGCDQPHPLAVDGDSEAQRRGEPASVARLKERHAPDLGAAASPVAGPTVSATSTQLDALLATATPIPYAPEPGPFANTVVLGDDATSGLLPIGFEFVFFDVTYSSFNISSNGFIGFDAAMSNGCCTGRPLPQGDGIDNIIALAWTDLFPPGGGQIAYETRGTAPNRRLIVSFVDLPWFPEFGVSRVTTQAILYEGSNLIEIHTTHQSAGHIYTQGVENAAATVAAALPGRVAANYGLVNDGVRFTTNSLRPVVDIRPGNNRNVVNPLSKGVMTVAVLTTSTARGDALDFDAATVDPSTVRFGPAGAPTRRSDKPGAALRDVDGDGDLDLALQFETQGTGIRAGDVTACLHGFTYGGDPLVGCDSITTVGPRKHDDEATTQRIPFAPEPGPFANIVSLADDQVSAPLPIGFDFEFFGANYTEFSISSNGFIRFDADGNSGCCTGAFIPEDDGINNLIALAWTDLFPPGGGQIAFETRGRRPHRRLIVSLTDLPWYPEMGVSRVTTQAILYEGSNRVEIHTTHQSAGHIYTQGIENAEGTVAAFLDGRVAADFGLDRDAVRFTTRSKRRNP